MNTALGPTRAISVRDLGGLQSRMHLETHNPSH